MSAGPGLDDCRGVATVVERTQLDAASEALAQTSATDAVVSGVERRLAIEHWLLTAANDRQQACLGWQRDGVARLRCGGVFTAVCVPMRLVYAAAAADKQWEIGVYLGKALPGGGAVFLCENSDHAYFLVYPTAWNRWRVPDTRCLTPDIELCVPHPDSASRWLLDMGGPGDLCAPDAVKQLVMFARFRVAQSGA